MQDKNKTNRIEIYTKCFSTAIYKGLIVRNGRQFINCRVQQIQGGGGGKKKLKCFGGKIGHVKKGPKKTKT